MMWVLNYLRRRKLVCRGVRVSYDGHSIFRSGVYAGDGCES